MEFGKNRVQYKEINWTYFNYDRYEVYFYEGGKEVASYVSRSVQKNLNEIEKYVDYQLEDKLQFIVYNKQSDFQQSNLGLITDEQYNVGGVTRIVGSKIVLYFEGDHKKLEEQIRSGIAEVVINQMLYGGNVKDMLKNSTLLALPDWYLSGLKSYIANKWNVDIDSRVRDGIMTERYTKFNRLTGADALYAGHSIWNYISETYGEQVIPNLLYMTKVSRNIESAFLFVLGVSVKNLSLDWYYYYKAKYQEDENKKLPQQPEVLKKTKNTRVYNQLRISPDGKYVVYATNELGQFKVWLYDLEKNKTTRLMKVGHKIDRITDYSYPLLAWHPSGKLFSIIVEKKGELKLITYTLEDKKKEERLIINFEKILDFSYSSDGKKFVMSAVQKGQSDIFVFTAASNAYEQITNDIFDDLHPRFAHNSSKIVFASNRLLDTLKSGVDKDITSLLPTKDIFVYNYKTKSKILKRVAATPSIDEDFPADYDSTHIAFVADNNGVRNRYLARFDSTISYIDTSAHYRDVITNFPITDYSRNILEQDIHAKSKKYTQVIYYKGKYRMYIGDVTSPSVTSAFPTELNNTAFIKEKLNKEKLDTSKSSSEETLNNNIKPIEITTVVDEQKENNSAGKINIDDYQFENDKTKTIVDKKTNGIQAVEVVDSSKYISDSDFKMARQKNYYINYATDFVVSQLDNSFLNATYQKFTGGGSPIYLNPGFTGLFKIGMSDLFEDYRIVAGTRLSGDLSSNEYFLSYENRIKNLDKQIVIHRQAFLNVGGTSGIAKVFTHDAKYVLRWPFSEVASIRGSAIVRNDKTVFLSTDFLNLKKPNDYDWWGGAKVEYVFDNTIKKGLNLYNGLRFKLFGEYFNQFDIQDANMVVIGADFRHYQKVHRDIIWANRFAASTSFGQQKLIYYMGGVDNWFNPRFDNEINIATDQNYAWQTLATPTRGFYQNIRNGNSFALINSELRIPVFKYLLNRPIKSDFINNFQLVCFGDLGTAWTGSDPFSEQNSLNKTIVATNGNPIVITINNQKQPIVGGFGYGLRSRIWGYFIRVDWAYGIEDGRVLPSVKDPNKKNKATLSYLSFSLDF